jgi:hypothetical protein
MGIFDRSKRNKPSQKQLELLSKITNPEQKKALLAAIESGEEIPDYAWEPIPEGVSRDELIEVAMKARAAGEQFRKTQQNLGSPSEASDPVQAFADKARSTATEATNYLCEPIDGCDEIGSAPDFIPLCAWGIFNPFGPTMTSVTLVSVPGGGEKLIFLRILHPMTPSAVVYGLLPPDVINDEEKLLSTLHTLFESNGSPECPLILGLPTHVIDIPGSPISQNQVKELLFLASQSAELGDIEKSCESLAMYKVDPWGRTSAEFKRALREAGKQTHAGENATPISRQQFERWWTLVTDPEHVQSEASQMRKAWEGAIQLLKEGLE